MESRGRSRLTLALNRLRLSCTSVPQDSGSREESALVKLLTNGILMECQWFDPI